MKKNMKKSSAAILLALTMSTVLVGNVFADTPVKTQQKGNGNGINCSEDCPRNGEGNGNGMKTGPKDGTRVGPKNGTGVRAQEGTCVLQK